MKWNLNPDIYLNIVLLTTMLYYNTAKYWIRLFTNDILLYEKYKPMKIKIIVFIGLRTNKCTFHNLGGIGNLTFRIMSYIILSYIVCYMLQSGGVGYLVCNSLLESLPDLFMCGMLECINFLFFFKLKITFPQFKDK